MAPFWANAAADSNVVWASAARTVRRRMVPLACLKPRASAKFGADGPVGAVRVAAEAQAERARARKRAVRECAESDGCVGYLRKETHDVIPATP